MWHVACGMWLITGKREKTEKWSGKQDLAEQRQHLLQLQLQHFALAVSVAIPVETRSKIRDMIEPKRPGGKAG